MPVELLPADESKAMQPLIPRFFTRPPRRVKSFIFSWSGLKRLPGSQCFSYQSTGK